MKNKSGSRSRNGKSTSSSTPKNIDLKISPINNNFILNNPLQVKTSHRPKVKGVAYKRNETHKMDWKQLKKKYPRMNPYHDSDFDGLVNSRDCKPLDPSKDGAFSRFLNVVTAGKKGQSKSDFKAEQKGKSLAKQIAGRERAKAVVERKAKTIVSQGGVISEVQKAKLVKRREALQKLRSRFKSKTADAAESALRRVTPTTRRDILSARARRGKGIVKTVERFAGVKSSTKKKGKSAKGQKQAGAGRPKQSYKYRDPRTNQPISAVQYHKLRKQLKSQAKAVETKTEVQQRFALAKRGLSPEEVSQAQEEINARMARLRAIKEAKQQGVATVASPTVASLPQGEEQEFEEQVMQEEAQQIPEEAIQQAAPTQAPTQYQPQFQRTQRIEPMLEVPGARGIPQGYRVQDDIMTGKKTLVPLPPREAWSR